MSHFFSMILGTTQKAREPVGATCIIDAAKNIRTWFSKCQQNVLGCGTWCIRIRPQKPSARTYFISNFPAIHLIAISISYRLT